jgi:hypothetical protein
MPEIVVLAGSANPTRAPNVAAELSCESVTQRLHGISRWRDRGRTTPDRPRQAGVCDSADVPTALYACRIVSVARPISDAIRCVANRPPV